MYLPGPSILIAKYIAFSRLSTSAATKLLSATCIIDNSNVSLPVRSSTRINISIRVFNDLYS
ncbi:MAG: hypothetical protein ABWW69_03650 [Pyrodictiaceae archaeon]